MIKMIDNCQHGSRRGWSTLSQLLELHYEIILTLAFNMCDYDILMTKMKTLGVTGKLARWIHNFLTKRKQMVMVNGIIS